ncbi:MAG: LapA family protein [Sedimentisphaerales bacterium]|nr:LapA family protein [Sedimentisphaerales bacterium]
MTMKKAKIIVLIVALILFLIVVFQNTQAVETKFLLIDFTMPRALLLILTFLVGLITGMIIASYILRVPRPKKPELNETKQS